jgi:isopentenyl diphosphate isomerase/L-lactate dehydrogenase-like FMN-dependent dehydrogenase
MILTLISPKTLRNQINHECYEKSFIFFRINSSPGRRPIIKMKSLIEIKKLVEKIITERIPSAVFRENILEGGAETGNACKISREALDRILLRMSVIHNVSNPKSEVTVLGKKLRTPIIPAPMGGSASLVCDDFFKKIIDGAKRAGTIVLIPAIPNMEDIMKYAKSVGCSVACIVKPFPNLEKVMENINKAEETGCFAVGMDLDSIGGLKYGDHYISEVCTPKDTETLKKIRQRTGLPFILKGLLSEEDAFKALEIGADMIVVSNHGGSALDYSQAPINVLPNIVKVVEGKVEILIDGSIRRGTDVLKALALGAKAVLIGRPILWGLAVDGAEGVFEIIDLMTKELLRAMILTGVEDAQKVPREVVIT